MNHGEVSPAKNLGQRESQLLLKLEGVNGDAAILAGRVPSRAATGECRSRRHLEIRENIGVMKN